MICCVQFFFCAREASVVELSSIAINNWVWVASIESDRRFQCGTREGSDVLLLRRRPAGLAAIGCALASDFNAFRTL